MGNQTIARLLKNGAIWLFVLLELLIFGLFADQYSNSRTPFLDPDNLMLVLQQAAPIGIIAVGMTVIMVNGNIDLSVGATYALAGIVLLDAMSWPAIAELGEFWSIFPAVALALGVGIGLGLLNGLIVWKTGVDAFIVTLGAMLGYRGLVFMYNGEEPTSERNWTLIDFLDKDYNPIFQIPIGGGETLNVSVTMLALILVVLLVWALMRLTVHGRNAYAVGDNRAAAVNAGIRVGPHMVWNFVLMGFLAAFSGVLFYGANGSVNPNDGTLYELWAITAVVLGGTRLTGGYGSIINTFGGVLAIQILRKGLGHVGADTATVNLVIGLILIAVLFLDKRLNRKGKEEVTV